MAEAGNVSWRSGDVPLRRGVPPTDSSVLVKTTDSSDSTDASESSDPTLGGGLSGGSSVSPPPLRTLLTRLFLRDSLIRTERLLDSARLRLVVLLRGISIVKPRKNNYRNVTLVFDQALHLIHRDFGLASSLRLLNFGFGVTYYIVDIVVL